MPETRLHPFPAQTEHQDLQVSADYDLSNLIQLSKDLLILGTPSPPSTPPLVPFPSARATSEPPPDHDEDYDVMSASRHAASTSVTRTPSTVEGRAHVPSLPSLHTSDTEEYTWDWGNFPQKTPIRSTFPHAHGHSQGTSVDLTTRKGKGRMMSEVPDAQQARARAAAFGKVLYEEEDETASYGFGGRLTVDKSDSTRYRVFIEGRTVEFELAVVPPEPERSSQDGKEPHAGTLGGDDEVEDAKFFDENKVDFHRFLLDETIVGDPHLVLRWGDRYVRTDVTSLKRCSCEIIRYIRRQDGSPLMDALNTWRESALQDKQPLLSSRPVSPQPLSEDESVKSDGDEPSDRRIKRVSTAPASDAMKSGKDLAATRTPSSSSWVRWWSRSRRAETRPDLGHTNSEPSAATVCSRIFWINTKLIRLTGEAENYDSA